MNSQRKYFALTATLALVIGAIVIVTATLRTNEAGAPIDNGINQASTMDAQFIVHMIPHHQGAIDMAELALDQAEHSELKELSASIIATQQAEINSMSSWYFDWYGQAVPAATHHQMNMLTMTGDLEALEASDNFDLTFIEQMIPHHESAITMAQIIQNATNHPELKTLAENIIASQTAEIEQMKIWRDQWK